MHPPRRRRAQLPTVGGARRQDQRLRPLVRGQHVQDEEEVQAARAVRSDTL